MSSSLTPSNNNGDVTKKIRSSYPIRRGSRKTSFTRESSFTSKKKSPKNSPRDARDVTELKISTISTISTMDDSADTNSNTSVESPKSPVSPRGSMKVIRQSTQVTSPRLQKSGSIGAFGVGEIRVVGGGLNNSLSSLVSSSRRPLHILRLKKIGKGGSGTNIWKVEVDGWIACMKELPKDMTTESDIRAFKKEIEILSNLPEHAAEYMPNLIRFLGCNETADYLQIFTTLYDGTLSDLLLSMRLKKQYFTEAQVIHYAKQLMGTLAILHSRRIMHRDIKSNNVFYRDVIVSIHGKTKVTSIFHDSGNSNDICTKTLILGDLGESKVIRQNDKAKTCAGTTCWMAPEVLKHNGEYDYSADVWSFGMLLYEIMTLRAPYQEMSIFNAQKNIYEGILPILQPDEEDRYNHIVPFWKKLLLPNPSQRPMAHGALIELNDMPSSDLIDCLL